eukprot:TRINITY_DN8132_c0_g1_i1.p1 TRINITY_DN8132_c0_g1~~TRINITY_DN8132_c0_g1_i1.p1  ORF type:complete len:196 (+),score=2.15 TRINITY_DN8132_c0_g1_i1:237-824(+)
MAAEAAARVGVDDAGIPYIIPSPTECDACPCCADVCELPACRSCKEKRQRLHSERWQACTTTTFTQCQVRRHNHTGSAWIVSGGLVFDITDYLDSHPGGKRSILRNAGGRDCKEDMDFHSKNALRLMRKYQIGRLEPSACRRGNLTPKRAGYAGAPATPPVTQPSSPASPWMVRQQYSSPSDECPHDTGGACVIC